MKKNNESRGIIVGFNLPTEFSLIQKVLFCCGVVMFPLGFILSAIFGGNWICGYAKEIDGEWKVKLFEREE